MFIVNLKDGRTLVEGKDVPYWDDVPSGITGIQLTLPFHRKVSYPKPQYEVIDGKTVEKLVDLPAPSVKIGRYDKYYCAYQAVANVMRINGVEGKFEPSGQGTITHQVMAGIDLKRQEVIYVELNVKTSDIQIKKLNIEEFKVSENSLKQGVAL